MRRTLSPEAIADDQQDAAERLRAAILARIDAIGQAEVARRVAPLWGYDNPRTAESRLSRWRSRSKSKKSMSAEALLALIVVLNDDGLMRSFSARTN